MSTPTIAKDTVDTKATTALPTVKKRIVRKSLKPTSPLGTDDLELDHEHFVYRRVNDKQVLRRERMGYEIVMTDGSQDRVPVNFSKDASSTHAVLMRIPREDYNEIQKFKKQENDEIMASVEVEGLGSGYGLKTRVEK